MYWQGPVSVRTVGACTKHRNFATMCEGFTSGEETFVFYNVSFPALLNKIR